MTLRINTLLNVTGEVETYYEPGEALWHWERVRINLYGYDLWAYLQVWAAHLPDLWVTPISSWEFVNLHVEVRDYKSVLYYHNVREHIVIDLPAMVEEEVVHLRVLRELL